MWQICFKDIRIHSCTYTCIFYVVKVHSTVQISLCASLPLHLLYVCVCVCMYVYVCMFVCTYVCMYVCICVYVRMYIYVYVCMYVCMYMYVCIYIYVCTSLHAETQQQSPLIFMSATKQRFLNLAIKLFQQRLFVDGKNIYCILSFVWKNMQVYMTFRRLLCLTSAGRVG